MYDSSRPDFGSKELIWLKEGIQLISGKGLANFKVDELSKYTGKAKTSFYHFFKSREEFLLRLAEYWEYFYTDTYILEIASINDPRLKLEKLIELVYPNMREELIWVYFKEAAISNPDIHSIVERVESKRVNLFIRIFQDMNYPSKVAHEKARVFIYLFFGWSVLQQDKTARSENIEEFKKVSFNLLLN